MIKNEARVGTWVKMKNGPTVNLTQKEKRQLNRERKETKLKDMADNYGLSNVSMRNVLVYGRCSQRIYKQIFNEEK